jgi:hypothetical protein
MDRWEAFIALLPGWRLLLWRLRRRYPTHSWLRKVFGLFPRA